ncbi:MAG: hypothetical protein AAF908_06645 [Pseudomonadota bacterium]
MGIWAVGALAIAAYLEHQGRRKVALIFVLIALYLALMFGLPTP